jgi:hypothetical protein
MAVERRARIGRIKPRVTPRIGRIKPRDIAGRLGGASDGSAGEGEDRVFEGLA